MSRFIQTSTRLFHSSSIVNTVKSSCAPGTVLKGLNVLQGGKDPVALKDEEYPDWLWKLADYQKTTFEGEHDKLSIKYLRSLSKSKIITNSMTK
ncbi:mitochondrial ribosomal protein L37-domain-containing protein [Globomyces pollinis-pini]|nr:mitochondrial ribosomal protein L37-domain-containing protein [Globomyces pollinis-pini]